MSLGVPVYYSNITTALQCQVNLLNGKGKSISTSTLTLGGAKEGNGRVDLNMHVALPKTSLEKTYRLVVSPTSATQNSLLDIPISLGEPRVANLCIVPGSARFTPAIPSEGETVFLRALVENRGLAPSNQFNLHVNSIDLKEKNGDGTPLFSKPDLSQLEQPRLAPGRSRWVNVRWDYPAWKDVAGKNLIRIRVEETGQAPNIEKKNNFLDVPLRILSRPNLKVFTLERKSHDINSSIKELDLTVNVENLGETTVSGRHLGFFNYWPKSPTQEDLANPKILVKDILLPPVAGHQKLTYSHKWNVDFTDPLSSPTAEVFRPTQSIRSGGEDVAVEPEW